MLSGRSDDPPESALISDSKRYAAAVAIILEDPRVKEGNGNSGFYVTAKAQCEVILHLVQESERCADAEEFDCLLHLIHCQVDRLALAVSRLRIP
jgi:hypothetical protein